LASSIIIFQVFLGFTSANVWLINRNPGGQPWINRDSFSIPLSLCQQNNGNDECDPFGAINDKHKNCSCICPSQNYSFVYHENKWTCLQNGKVRNLQGKRIRQPRMVVFLIYSWWNVKNMLLFILFILSCSCTLSGWAIINITFVPPTQITAQRLNWENRGSNFETEIIGCLDFVLFRGTESFRDLVVTGHSTSKSGKYFTLT